MNLMKFCDCHAAVGANVDCACDMRAGFLAHKGQQKLAYQVLALLWGAAAIAGELTLPLASAVGDHLRYSIHNAEPHSIHVLVNAWNSMPMRSAIGPLGSASCNEAALPLPPTSPAAASETHHVALL